MTQQPLHRPILVTGAHRSGTTWVGKMLAAGGQAAYISEPMNVLHRPGVLRTPVQYWYTYIHNGNEGGISSRSAGDHFLSITICPEWVCDRLRSGKDLARMGRDLFIFLRGRIKRQIPLLKDPFAIFSAPWFPSRLDCRVVITIRHPAAFASSLKRLDWPFDFSDLLAQTQLMQDWLEPFRQEIETISAGATAPMKQDKVDTIASASLLWLMIYTFVKKCLGDNPDFILVRHEDLSADPVKGFNALYSRLGLDFSAQAEKKILQASSPDNPGELTPKATYSIHLDSQANLQNWKRRLTPEEIQKIRALTGSLCQHFYPDQTWA